ncbi:hypothetical protein LCGC14_2892970, partial [marine sediment metagenome]
RKRLAPILFDDHQRSEAEQSRQSVVAPAPRSPAARRKDFEKRTADGTPVESFQTLLDNLGTLTKNRVRLPCSDGAEFYVLAQPTPLQHRALALLEALP